VGRRRRTNLTKSWKMIRQTKEGGLIHQPNIPLQPLLPLRSLPPPSIAADMAHAMMVLLCSMGAPLSLSSPPSFRSC